MNDKKFLMWLHNRLVNIHGENPFSDYMHKLRAIIKSTPEDKTTPNISTEYTLKVMYEDII